MKVEMKTGEGPSFVSPLKTPDDLALLKTEITNELEYFYDSLFATRI